MIDVQTAVLTVLACGAGTFLLRALPLWRRGSAAPEGAMRRFSEAIGPCAMAALLVATVMPLAPLAQPLRSAAVAAALLATWGVWRWRRGMVWPMFAGAAAYGLCLTWL